MAGVIGLALKLFIENGVPDYYIQGTSGGLGPIAFYLASELYAEARKSSGDTDYINPLHVVLAQSENSMPFGMIGPGIQDYDSMVHHADEHYQSVGAGINQVLKTRLPSRQFFDFFVGLYNKRRMKVYLVSDIELGFTRRHGFEDASCSALVAYDKATDGSTGNRYIKNGTVWISNTGNNQ
ncbi:MAG: hypothetical protein KKF44_11750 [Nanoarchaeota archaeon]|nr:hypothetical protein [Nanoarchaeota archaeon]